MRVSVFGPWRGNRSAGSGVISVCNFLFFLGRLQNLEAAHESIVDRHHSTGIIEFAAVVRGREKSHKLSLGKELIPVFYDLVSAADKVDIMLLVEGGDDLLTEGERDTSVVLSPALNVLVGVRPQKVTEEAGVGDVGGSHNALDLLERAELRAQTSVHAQDLLIDDGSDGQAIEAVGEGLPQLDVVAALALVVEAVDSIDRGTLVISSQQEEVLGVLDLVGQEEAHGLKGLLSAVHIVSQEEVVGIGWEPAILEKSEEIIVLTMHIT